MDAYMHLLKFTNIKNTILRTDKNNMATTFAPSSFNVFSLFLVITWPCRYPTQHSDVLCQLFCDTASI